MIIYRAHNPITGKSYIGKTSIGLDWRRKEHIKKSRNGSPFYFHNALRKYGDIFEWSILEENVSSDRELYWIERYDTFNSGYNMTKGGDGGDTLSNHPDLENIKKKISEGQTGLNNHFFGKRHSEKIKKQISKNMQNKIPWNVGKCWSEDHKKNLSTKAFNKIKEKYNLSDKDFRLYKSLDKNARRRFIHHLK